ncbi:cytochrome P450 [Streptomyces sp. SID4946]|uniref:cytochrome P450 family protein n=1 Tax=Streptomyces TaxID=1883 RepID=UPI00081D46C6|nr:MULTISPECIES: cytochrome P450 [unclassified Streptomyces]MYQ96606.1 cytochrome P450 [Streptomyces sp. SID4946]SCG01270.1 Cytochrome P450 [Streptomyces sp. DconLS]SCG05654.1 Cytochrome P450 [Streptomyces sp. LamerLS-31b]
MSPTPQADGQSSTAPHQAPASQTVRPLEMTNGTRLWLITGYAEVRQALADPRIAKDSWQIMRILRERRIQVHQDIFSQAMAHHMLNTDPPEHHRLRQMVNKSFTMRRVQQLRPRIEQVTDELLDAVRGLDVVDVIDTLAFPLPIIVICELLGVPERDRNTFRAWISAFLLAVEPEVRLEASTAMDAYIRQQVAAKRAAPDDDMISVLATEESEDRLSDDEIVAMIVLLLAAGHETTVNLIGNGMLALVTHPAQFAELRADRSLLPGAIEEFLRYDGPVNQATLRFTSEPVEIGGRVIPEGEFVMLNIDSANHDPQRYADPDRFDLHRDARGHLSFGHGIHFCLGAPLARLEAEVVFGRLLDTFDEIELAAPVEQLEWRSSTLMRGLEKLPVRMK